MLTPFELSLLAIVALAAWFAGRAAAHKRARSRNDVLSIVAHDLRNPLSLISSSSSLLLEQPELSPERRARMLQITQRAVGQMNRLTSDLLDATRLQAGQLKLELASVDARAVLAEIDETFRHAALEKQITLRCVVPDNQLLVWADNGRVHQALGNLVSNALKFTPAGGEVTVRADDCVSGVVFSVADTGSGISIEQQRKIFDRFFQARAGDLRGVGLGLAITKGIVDAHGGSIWVQSAPGKGSTFYFSLPGASLGLGARPLTYAAFARSAGMLPRLRSPLWAKEPGDRMRFDQCLSQSIRSDADSSELRLLQSRPRASA